MARRTRVPAVDPALQRIAVIERGYTPQPMTAPGLVASWRKATGAVRTNAAPWPFSVIGGPVTHAATMTALGTGIGYLYGRYVHPFVNPDVDRRKSGRTAAILGGGIGALTQVPAAAFALSKSSAWSPSTGIFGPAPHAPGPFITHGFSAGHAREDIASDRYLSPYEKSRLLSSVPSGRGMITAGDVARGALGAGIGYTGAGLLGTTLGTLFGMSRPTQRKLRTAGAIAGALRGTGFL